MGKGPGTSQPKRLQKDSKSSGGVGSGSNTLHQLQTDGRAGQVAAEAGMGERQQEPGCTEAEVLLTLAEATSPKVAVVPGEGEATGVAGGREAVGREGGLYQELSLWFS